MAWQQFLWTLGFADIPIPRALSRLQVAQVAQVAFAYQLILCLSCCSKCRKMHNKPWSNHGRKGHCGANRKSPFGKERNITVESRGLDAQDASASRRASVSGAPGHLAEFSAESGALAKLVFWKPTILHRIWGRSLVFYERLIFHISIKSCLDEDICWWLGSYEEVRIRWFSCHFQARRKQPLPSAKLKISWTNWRCHFGIQEGLGRGISMNLKWFLFPLRNGGSGTACLPLRIYMVLLCSTTWHPHGNLVVGKMLGNQWKNVEHVWETWLARVPFKGHLEMQSSFKWEYATSAAPGRVVRTTQFDAFICAVIMLNTLVSLGWHPRFSLELVHGCAQRARIYTVIILYWSGAFRTSNLWHAHWHPTNPPEFLNLANWPLHPANWSLLEWICRCSDSCFGIFLQGSGARCLRCSEGWANDLSILYGKDFMSGKQSIRNMSIRCGFYGI